MFHKQTLRGFLKLSKSSPIPSLYFLLGELPIEAQLHIQTLTLFHNIWANPDTTVHKMVKYILMMSDSNSTTWSNHISILCQMYRLPSPLHLLENQALWSKSEWKLLVKTNVTIFHENQLRQQSLTNSKMIYFNTSLLGLSGRPHPALLNIKTTQDARNY